MWFSLGKKNNNSDLAFFSQRRAMWRQPCLHAAAGLQDAKAWRWSTRAMEAMALRRRRWRLRATSSRLRALRWRGCASWWRLQQAFEACALSAIIAPTWSLRSCASLRWTVTDGG